MMKKLPKGQFGYLEKRKKREILFTLCLFAVALILYVIGLILKKTNQNMFPLFAILMCLPASRYLVSSILYVRAKGCSLKVRDMIRENVGELYGEYDLYFTSYNKNFAFSHMFYADGSLIGLSEDPSMDEKAFVTFMEDMLQKGQRKKCSIHVLTDPEKYCRRMREMNALVAAFDAETKEKESDRIADLFVLIHSITL